MYPSLLFATFSSNAVFTVDWALWFLLFVGWALGWIGGVGTGGAGQKPAGN